MFKIITKKRNQNSKFPLNKLSFALALSLGVSQNVQSQFSKFVDLSNFNGNMGFAVEGVNQLDGLGRVVSSAGDLNGDGIDDVVFGAYTDIFGSQSGSAYVVFGTSIPQMMPLSASDLNGNNGFEIQGVNAYDFLGSSVSGLGDVNGDGIDDVLVGAGGADSNAITSAGSSYVIFGKTTTFTSPLIASSIDGSNGIVINGENASDYAGIRLSNAGDINGDGINDMIIAANSASPNGITGSGRTYIVYGNSNGLTNPINLSDINGSNGFVVNGESTSDYSGSSVAMAGDINGDGIDDLLISAPYANLSIGKIYVVYGSSSGLPASLDLSALNGSNGILINGETPNMQAGHSINFAGDFNNDGIDDILIGAPRTKANAGGSFNEGRVYVVYGNNNLPNPLNLSSINGTNGVVINGSLDVEMFGASVSTTHDVNNDGIDDIVIGAPNAKKNGPMGLLSGVGKTYVFYGSSNAIPSPLNLSGLTGIDGMVITGADDDSLTGDWVSHVKDFNGDGVSDFIIGVRGFTLVGTGQFVGKSYVIYGTGPKIFKNGFE